MEGEIARHSSGSDVHLASVIIPARNAACHVGRCIEALLRDGLPVEIIVVDDASTDDTASIAEARSVRVISLPSQSGPAIVRNVGVQASQADILIFVDADVEVAPGSLGHIIDFLYNQPQYAAVFGSYDDSPGGPSLVSRYRDLILHFRHQTAKLEADTFWTGFGAVRRQAFQSVGGFADDGIEDIEFGSRLRFAHHRIALQRGLLCRHHKHWTLLNMIHTDLLKRALPWSRLLLERRCWASDLNLRQDRRLGVALVAAGPVGFAASFFEPMLVLLGLMSWAGALLIERDFFRFLWSKNRTLTLAAIPLHLVHLSAAATGFVLASLLHIAQRSLAVVPWRTPRACASAAPQ